MHQASRPVCSTAAAIHSDGLAGRAPVSVLAERACKRRSCGRDSEAQNPDAQLLEQNKLVSDVT